MSALTDRDVNAQPTSDPATGDKQATAGDGNKGKEPQQSKQLLDRIAQNKDKSGQAYVSPSDAILSPASKKLANFKQKQINKKEAKQPAARTLFARSTSSEPNGADHGKARDEKS